MKHSVKKLIFLDIDGVLNCADTPQRMPGNPKHFGIDPLNLAELMVILHSTNAKIVISSSWRHMGLPKIKEIMSVNVGPSVAEYVMSRVIGQTPTLSGSRVRGREIENWLWMNDLEERTCRFTILDDYDDMDPYEKHLFRTSNEVGLTQEIAERVIEYLNNETNEEQT